MSNTSRKAFTMVELIFSIIIIGVLAMGAIPKFTGIKDRAKIASEIKSMSALESMLEITMEFQLEDYGNFHFDWHNHNPESWAIGDEETRKDTYKEINDEGKVFSSVLRKSNGLRIIGYGPLDFPGVSELTKAYSNPLIIKGIASHRKRGAAYTRNEDRDVPGKPDKNDFWIVNPSGENLEISIRFYGSDDSESYFKVATVNSGEVKLIDIEGYNHISGSELVFKRPDSGDEYYDFYFF